MNLFRLIGSVILQMSFEKRRNHDFSFGIDLRPGIPAAYKQRARSVDKFTMNRNHFHDDLIQSSTMYCVHFDISIRTHTHNIWSQTELVTLHFVQTI